MREIVYKGKRYASMKILCAAYGRKYPTVWRRIHVFGLSLELALEAPLHLKIVKDHLGNYYPTTRAMADHYGLEYTLVCNRLYRGWTIERTLTTPADTKKRRKTR